MNCYDNFNPRCSSKEAAEVAKHIPLTALQAAYDSYKVGYLNSLNEKYINDRSSLECIGLCSVYTLGFLSGCRAMKERSRKRNDIQTKRNRA